MMRLAKLWLFGRVVKEWAAVLLLVTGAGVAVVALWRLVSTWQGVFGF